MSNINDELKRFEDKYSDENMNTVLNSDKISYNKGIDDCIQAIRQFSEFGYIEIPTSTAIQSLEQLKKPLQ